MPPQPPRQDAPAAPATPPPPRHRPASPDTDPRTTVLRPVPADPSVPPPPQAPPRPATPPPAPPRPRTQPPAAPQMPPHGAGYPPAPPAPPRQAPPPAPATPPPPRRPASFQDTAAFHLANSQALWTGGRARGRTPGAPPTPRPSRPVGAATGPYPGAATPSAAPVARAPRSRRRRLAIAACLVLGMGLIGGAAAGSWLTGAADAAPTPADSFAKGRDLWHDTPVDTLFPRTVDGLGVGPGGSDRRWTRIAVAPDGGCAKALDPALAKALAPAGCTRLLRATYTDATRSSVITVGALTTKTDAPGMLKLNSRFSTDNDGARTTMLPLPYAAKGTAADGFGRAQRASWTVRILTDVPVVVYAVSGFADGRTVTDPQPAESAVRPGTTTAPAESGLGHDAKALADRIEAILRKAAGIPVQTTEEP
ncbi:hypothetical protein B1H19_09990 [Streptomyces gilvosporeus]|uniref:Uncharacterized protein n=1 Tax=Streptomyces gilvosporeus TaxID=553510 RepID=A0A1V0U2F0_9ACTN|nr:hypothetical protein B1H19_09990 [Streptomyces gilvosporeus]